MKGRKESDHNTILMEINTNYKKETKTVKRWKLDNTDGWKEFNQQIKLHCEQNEPQTQEILQILIKKIMMNTVGQRTITIGKNKPKKLV